MKPAEQSETIRVIRRHSIKPKKGQIDSTWLLLLALLPFLFAGCSTGNGGGGSSQGNYRGPPEWRDTLLAETHRQHVYTGGEVGEASKVSINAYRCGSPSGETKDGPYACDPSCTRGVDACIHAWNLSRPGSWGTEYLFVTKPGEMFPLPIGQHEVGHFTFRDSPEAINHPTGHPDKVTIRGKVYRCRDVIGGARWPAKAFNAVTFGVFSDKTWDESNCTRDGARQVTGIAPEEESK